MLSLQFCPGGGSSKPAPGDLKSVKVRIHTADTKLLAHWVSDASKSQEVTATRGSEYEAYTSDFPGNGRHRLPGVLDCHRTFEIRVPERCDRSRPPRDRGGQ